MSKRTNITFTDEMHEAVSNLSDRTGIPFAHIVREAVDQYLEKEIGLDVDNSHPERGGYRPKSPASSSKLVG